MIVIFLISHALSMWHTCTNDLSMFLYMCNIYGQEYEVHLVQQIKSELNYKYIYLYINNTNLGYKLVGKQKKGILSIGY